MSRNRASDQRKSGRGTVEVRKRRRMRPTLMTLEDRLAPAMIMDSGARGTLTFVLSANDTVAIVANANTYTLRHQRHQQLHECRRDLDRGLQCVRYEQHHLELRQPHHRFCHLELQ